MKEGLWDKNKRKICEGTEINDLGNHSILKSRGKEPAAFSYSCGPGVREGGGASPKLCDADAALAWA